MSESITGYIDHIIFRNEDNGYTVMVLKGVSEEDELTCVGSFPVVTQGASVELEGNFTQHPVYGKQFQAVRLTEKMPEDALAMERYLGSGAIKGIGAALASHLAKNIGNCFISDFRMTIHDFLVCQSIVQSPRRSHLQSIIIYCNLNARFVQ